ncbi:YitT family protein [Sedimentibacter sp. B4]|uniref:YczE/YyaS/YitT family protein n=1 Tax=Sedimentibacter sp. B4 TaxID=304766 RepID=UPI00030F94EE|nr:hypothetical protein [Sedimentibacter sp. B4]
MKTKYMKYTVYSILAFLLLGLGISLQIKAGIGQSMLNAFALTMAELFHLEVGTMLNILNILFFVTYFLIRKTSFDSRDVIQILATMANGYIINFFVYYVFHGFVIESYLLKALAFLLGLCLASVSLGAIMAIEIIKFPLESLCVVLCKRLKKNLMSVRMGFDILFLFSTLIITFMSGNTLFIREGTVISFLLLSRLMGLTYDFLKNRL